MKYVTRLTIVGFLAVLLCPLVSFGKGGADGAKHKSHLVITTNWAEDNCSLVDIEQGKELAKIDVGQKPYDVKVGPAGRFAYVTCSGSDFLATIDIQAMLEMTDRRVVVGASPRDLALTPDNKRAIVACAGTDGITVVDIVNSRKLYSVDVGAIPYGIALTNDGKLALVTCWGANTAVLVELGKDSGKVLKTLNVGSLPYTVVISKDDRIGIVSCFGSHKVFAIDIENQKVIGQGTEVGRSPWGLALSGSGQALTANFYSNDVSVLSVDSGANPPIVEEARIRLVSADDDGTIVQRRAKNATFAGAPNIAVISDLANNELMIVDTDKKLLIRTIKVGKAPYGIAWIPKASDLVVVKP